MAGPDPRELGSDPRRRLAELGHELRNPLAGLSGLTQLLLDSPLNHEQREIALSMRTSVDSLLVIVRDALSDLHGPEQSPTPRTRPFNLQNELDRLHHLIAASTPGAADRLQIEPLPSVPAALLGDPDRLRQILRNLLDNAFKHASPGPVRLRVRDLGQRERCLELLFEVQDQGPGLGTQDQERVFLPFERGQTCSEGLGLGLAIARRLVFELGGTLGVISEPLQGSTFWFKLPFEPVSTVSSPVPVEPQPIGQGADVLVVEDDPLHREVLRALLQKLGYHVQTRATGPSALQRLREHRFHAVLTDIRLPGFDGHELARRVRALEAPCHTAMMGMTAMDLPEERERCLLAGLDECLLKPIRLQDLGAWLARQRLSVPPDLDHGVLLGLARIKAEPDDGREFVGSLVNLFLQDAPSRLSGMRGASEKGERSSVAFLAHAMKSSCGNLGLVRLRLCCEAVEATFSPLCEDPSAGSILLTELEERFMELRPRLAELCAGATNQPSQVTPL